MSQLFFDFDFLYVATIRQRYHSRHGGGRVGVEFVWRRRRRDDDYNKYDGHDGGDGQERRRDTNVVQGIKARWDDEPYAFEDTLCPDHLNMNYKRNGGFVSGNVDELGNTGDFMVRGDDDKAIPGTDLVYFDTQIVPGNFQEMPSEGGYQGP